MASGNWFKCDMAATKTFSRIDLDAYAAVNPNDYPRGWSLSVSADDSSYTAVTTGTGSSAFTTLSFTAQTARYFKITLTSAAANWWGIAEMTVYGSTNWVPLSSSGWTPTASRTNEALANALDGDRSNRWSTGGSMLNTDWYKVDMGSAQTFSRVEWDIGTGGAWGSDYPTSWTLAVSNDNSSYTTVTTGSSSTGLTNVIFAAQTARYIKLSSNTTNGCCWWGIGEFRVFTPTTTTQLSRNGWTVSASNTDGASPVGNSIDNNLATRWASGLAQANGHWFKVDMTQSLSVNAIVMDSYTNTSDYPTTWKLETSTDNSSYTTVTANQTGAGEYIQFTFATRSARYIRVTQTGSASNWWSISEFNVYGTPANASISSSASVAAVTISESVTLTQGSGNTLTTTGDFTQSAGTFTGGNSLISLGGNFTLAGGTFTSTGGVLAVSGAYSVTGGTFTHNSGRVVLASTSNQTFASNGNTFYDLAINDGLVGYWKLDDGTTPIVDSSGYAQSGTLSNTPTWGAGPTLNFTNSNSMTLNGTSQMARISRTSALEPAAVTVAAWIKRNGSQTQYAKIVSKTYSNASTSPWGSYELELNVGGSDSSVAGFTTGTSGPNANTVTSATNAVPDGTWTHVVGVYNPSGSAPQMRLYVNGVSAGTATVTGAVIYDSSSTGDLYIGQPGNALQYFKGSVDDVRIYNRALTAAEINSLYIGNQPGTSLATQTMTGAPTIVNDLTLASGTLSVTSNNLTVGGRWNNYGGIFTAGTGTVTLNSTGSKTIRSAGQPFNNLTLSGSGGTFTLEDWLKVNSALTMTNGALAAGSYAVHASDLNKTSGTFTAGTSTVVIDTITDVTQSTGFSFNNLRVETPDETGLVGYWRFDEGQGTTIRDASGTGNDGTLSGAYKWLASSLASLAFDNHAAITTDGSTAYASAGATSMPSGAAAKSISAWINATTSAANRDIVTMASAGGIVVTLGLKAGTLAVWKTGGVVLAQVSAPANNSWHHVAYTFDGTTHSVYLDGGTPATGTTALSGTVSGINIGSREGSTEMFSGVIDDVRIYNVALTLNQVKNLAAGRYSGVGGNTIVTLGADSSASGVLAIDNGTLTTSSYTMNASSGSNVVAVGSGGTYTVGSATQTMAGGLTVSNGGTVNLATASGTVSIGSGKILNMDGTLNASSTSATIQAVSGTYDFNVCTSSTGACTLNISGLAVKNTSTNGMYINSNGSASVTTFTRFDNLIFTNGAAAGYNLRIYAPSLNLTSSGSTFDSGVTATVTNNVYLQGTSARALFGGSTCASNKTDCEVYDLDDDNGTPPDGVADGTGGVVQWIRGAQTDTSGTIEGFPTAAFDWSSFTYYATYVAYHDTGGTTADTVYVRTTTGAANYSWSTATGEEIIGTPRWETVGGSHYVYVATNDATSTGGKIYRLKDASGALTLDTVAPWNGGANNPYACSCTITTPMAQDNSYVYFGGIISSTHKLWSLSKTSSSPRLAGNQPLATSAATNNTAPAIWTSGSTYAFLGLNGRVAKINTSTQVLDSDNTNPGSSNPVMGRITIIASTLYAGDDNGYFWSLDPGTNFATLAGLYKNWGYHDTTVHTSCGGTCQIRSHYFDPTYNRVYYGDQDGHLYALTNAGALISASYPYRPGTSGDAFATAPFFRSGVLLAGTTTGTLYIIDQASNASTVPAKIQTYNFGSSTQISGIAYDNSASNYLIATANGTNKDGKLYVIASVADPTTTYP